MSRKSRLLQMLLVALLLTSCGVETPRLLTPRPMAKDMTPYPGAPLEVSNVKRIAELASFRAEHSGPVIALAFTPKQRQLVAAYQDGMLRRWQVDEGSLQAEWTLSSEGLALASFDGSTRLLATVPDGMKGLHLWNTDSEELSYEWELRDLDPISVLAVSPDGRFVFGGMSGGGVLRDLAVGRTQGIGGAIEVDGELGVPMIPTAATFDPTGEWVVIGYEHGVIEVEVWDEGLGLFHPGRLEFSFRQCEDSPMQGPLAIAMDPTRRWLAAVVGESLQVWDMSIYLWFLTPRRVRSGIGGGSKASLAYSPDGKLLAVGTSEGWRIWSVPGLRRIAQDSGFEVSAVAFSPDGRLFAWGDKDGAIHVWGVVE